MLRRNFFIKWFEKNGRTFPWRYKDTTPFQFLVTEILLQQTKAEDVAKMWNNFLNKYPDAVTMSKARVSKLFLELKFLGFGNKRAKALKSASLWLIKNHNGQVPNTLKELLAIPYVGDYAARAILCFAFNQKIEIVDANFLRLFSRYFGLQFNRDARRAPQAWEIARQLLPREKKKAKPHNYGLLDFTAQVCKSGRPRCEICPLCRQCVFGRELLDIKT